jgi:uncharacterized membrane protein YdfJ with MMPL/SSD domain
METEDISFVLRCLLAMGAAMAIVGVIFTYDLLLELPWFATLLFRLGLG